MSYSKSATPFVTWAIEQGCARAHKGWGMLVEQAAEAFTLWRGVRPDTEPVLHRPWDEMSPDANISGTTLPAFDRIRARRRGSRRSASCCSATAAKSPRSSRSRIRPSRTPCCRSSSCSHRLSRTWSPISHLNGVLNSDELRASYNACLPLLSNYWTDLAQSEPLFRAYSAIAANEAGRARCRRSAASSSARSKISASRASGCPQERKARYKAVVQELAHARRQVRRERARCDERLDAARHRRGTSSPASTP